MARRAWQAPQDVMAETVSGDIPTVSQESLAKAVLDGVVMLDRAGGCLSVVLVRQPTGIPNEMVTIRAIVEWKDRTDARPQPEQADPFGGALPAPSVAVDDVQDAETVLEDAEASPEGDLVIGDGLDGIETEVDMSSVPEHLR